VHKISGLIYPLSAIALSIVVQAIASPPIKAANIPTANWFAYSCATAISGAAGADIYRKLMEKGPNA
jgi:hypothetical protein